MFQQQIAWAKAGGADIKDVKMKVNDNGIRGIFANQRFRKGEVIMNIPASLWIQGPLDVVVKSLKQNLELKGRSYFWPWLRMLPTHQDFKSFHPTLIDPEIREAFADLAIGYQ